MANKYDDADGVWRTIGGRRVFIRTGQSLSDAMIESGKFSRVKKNEELYKKIEEEPKLTEKQKDAAERLNKKAENGVRSDIKDFLSVVIIRPHYWHVQLLNILMLFWMWTVCRENTKMIWD